jgi:hypothetical protein
MWRQLSERNNDLGKVNDEITKNFAAANDKKYFLNVGLQIPAPLQSYSSMDELFNDADVLSAPFQDLICCWMNGSPNISDFCDKEFVDLFTFDPQICSSGKPNIGPIKQITRSIAKIHRSYGGNFRLLTDLVSQSAKHQLSPLLVHKPRRRSVAP